jgi:hypothetical protein
MAEAVSEIGTGTLLSSRATSAVKLALLVLTAGGCAYMAYLQLHYFEYLYPPLFIGMLLAGALLLALWKFWTYLADRVEDHGDHLLVSCNFRTWLIPMQDIVSARFSLGYRGPSRVWLCLRGRRRLLCFWRPFFSTPQSGRLIVESLERRMRVVTR